jgi:hypothetical protein
MSVNVSGLSSLLHYYLQAGVKKITEMFVSVASLHPDLKAGPLELKELRVLLAPYAVFLNKFPQYLKRVTPI